KKTPDPIMLPTTSADAAKIPSVRARAAAWTMGRRMVARRQICLWRMPGYGRHYWAERTAPNRRRTYPKFRGDTTADAVVIGGGLTGCATAFALTRAGANVVLLEADRLAAGGTSAGLGVIVPQPDAAFRSTDALAGRKPSRVAWELAEKSAGEFAA